MNVVELKADLDELKKLEVSASRMNVKNVLKQEIIRLQTSLTVVRKVNYQD